MLQIKVFGVTILLQLCTIFELKYLLIETNEDGKDILKSGSGGKSVNLLQSRSAGSNKQYGSKCGQSYVPRAPARIIGGTEITPHSEPWLASVCEYDDPM